GLRPGDGDVGQRRRVVDVDATAVEVTTFVDRTDGRAGHRDVRRQHVRPRVVDAAAFDVVAVGTRVGHVVGDARAVDRQQVVVRDAAAVDVGTDGLALGWLERRGRVPRDRAADDRDGVVEVEPGTVEVTVVVGVPDPVALD